MKTNPSVIYLKNTNRDGFQSFDEAQAGGAITPGHILELDHSTTPPTAIAHDGDPAYDSLSIALEKEYDDDNSQYAVEAAYAADEQLRYVQPKPGDHLWVLAAVGETLSVGDIVINGGATTPGCFAGAGTVDATTVTNTLKGKALTAVTGGASPVRFKMEVL